MLDEETNVTTIDPSSGIDLQRRAQDVRGLYRAILRREPESEDVLLQQAAVGDLEVIARNLLNSDEYLSYHAPDFPRHDLINRAEILKRHANADRPFQPGYITNFLGVATNVNYCDWTREGVEPALPMPGNFHATEIEWAAALRAVDLAGDDFTVIELGAGWGCWSINAAFAAKRLGKRVLAIGVEGDEGHASWIDAHGAMNGLGATEVRTDRSVAWSDNGFAVFPRSENSAGAYGQEPQFFPTAQGAEDFAAGTPGGFDVLEAKTLAKIAGGLDRIDLLHIDIQGGEGPLVAASLDFLKQKVAYIVIGTHGRDIEGALISALRGEGWILEIEEPCTIPLPLYSNIRYADGLQGWRNPVLLPVG